MRAAILLLVALAVPALSQIKREQDPASAISGTAISPSTVTVSGTGSKCLSVDDPTLVVDCGNDRVGVGDATPTQKLDVAGTIGISDVQAAAITGGNFIFGNPAGGGTQGVYLAAGGDYGLAMTSARLIGIGTASPATKLHMSSGTLTVDGTGAAINVLSTFTVANSGIITGASQPAASVSLVSFKAIPSGGLHSVFFDSVQVNRQSMFDATNSSDTLTARGAGVYLVTCSAHFAANTTGTQRTVRLITGSTYKDVFVLSAGNSNTTVVNTHVFSLADGTGMQCKVGHDVGSNLNIGTSDANSRGTSFSMVKLW